MPHVACSKSKEMTEMSEMEIEIPIQTEEKPNRKVVKTILDNFSKLINPHESVRVKSAANLLKYLVENSGTEEGSNELKYALKRLIRGLGAPTLTTRIGYYTTLVALLNLNLNVDASNLLDSIKAELHKSGKNSDGENADICAGQILVCGAIIRAGLWEKTTPEHQKELIQILLAACKERTYLGLFGYSFIVELINLVPEIGAQLIEEISKPWADQSLDTLYLLLKLKLACPKIFNTKFVKKTLETPDIICDESLESLCSILMTIPRATSLKHPLYEEIVSILNPSILPSFFSELDTHLKTPNRNRLLVFIKILTNTLIYGPKSDELFNQIPTLFTRNLITQLLGYFRTFKGKQKDKEYHDAVQKLFETLIELFKTQSVSSNVKISVIKKLLFDPGTFVFEKVTKSKVVQQITSTLDPEGVKNLASVYRGVTDGSETINSENDSETWLNNDRLYSAHMLIKLLSFPTMKQESDWKVEQLTFLLGISLLSERNGMNVGRELAESLKSAFFGSLDLKLSKLEELHAILSKLVQSLDAKLNPENLDILPRNPLSLETYELWKKTLHTVKKIEKKQKKSGISSVFLTLFLHMGLQLFNDVKLATDSLKELFSCYERIKKDKKAKHALDNTTLENTIVESENDPCWIEVVIDLFLNLLSHNSHLLRSIIKSVFPHLCQYMTSTTIHQILSVLDPKNDENPLSKDEASDSESENEDDGESESEDEKNSDEENHSEAEASDDEALDGDETVTDKLRMALHQALSNGAAESDEESIDLDQMSETEGEKLDRALADAFREFRPNHGRRKKQTKDQETLTHFRIRVLDLIETYLDSNPSMLLTLEIMLPLLQSVEFSIRDEHQKPLNNRLKNILKKLLGSKKFSDIDGVNDSILVELLKSLLDKGSKNVLIVQEMGEQISNCCIFVVKCSEMLRGAESTPAKVKKHLKNNILEVISGELHQFFTRRDCLTPYVLFKNLLQLSWEGNIGLAIILLDFMFSSEIRQFKKNQVAELLKIFYLNQRLFSQYKSKAERKMDDAHGQFAAKVVEYFKDLCNEPERKNIKERFICIFFNLLTAMRQSPLEQSKISWSDIAHNVREYRSYKSFSKDAKMAFNKLCKALGVSNIVPMKQQVTKLATLIDNEDADSVASKEDVAETGQKKKHKRKSNETLKLKKEAKQLRLNSLSKGLGGVEFEGTKIDEETLPFVETDVDSSSELENTSTETKEKKKKVKNTNNLEVEAERRTRKKKRKISEDIAMESAVEIQLNGSNTMDTSLEKSNRKKQKKLKQNSISLTENGTDPSFSDVSFNKKKRVSKGGDLTKIKNSK